jgi:hypothetical protein
MTRTSRIAIGFAAALAFSAATALAHGGGWGMGHGMGYAMGQGCGGYGPGAGAGEFCPGGPRGQGGWGGGPGAWGGGPGAVAGQQLFTAEERAAFRDKMRNAATADERRKLADAQRAEVQKRAAEKGITLPCL